MSAGSSKTKPLRGRLRVHRLAPWLVYSIVHRGQIYLTKGKEMNKAKHNKLVKREYQEMRVLFIIKQDRAFYAEKDEDAIDWQSSVEKAPKFNGVYHSYTV